VLTWGGRVGERAGSVKIENDLAAGPRAFRVSLGRFFYADLFGKSGLPPNGSESAPFAALTRSNAREFCALTLNQI
jgi:hypothetical protein